MKDDLRLLMMLMTAVLCSGSIAFGLSEDVTAINGVDKLIEKRLEKEGLELNEPTSDDQFLRRAFLTAIGRIPTYKESLEFSDLSSISSRQALIDHLYRHEGYQSHIMNWIMDLLRLRDEGNSDRMDSTVLVDWVREGVATNMPWDQMAYELVSTKGNAWTGSGAAGYYAMEPNMQNDNLAATTFAFLGVKLECAQCHDDPTQEWERMDFYELSAFVSGGTLLSRPSANEYLKTLSSNDPDNYNVKTHGSVHNFKRFMDRYARFGVVHSKGAGTTKLPKNWQYADGEPNDKISARTPFGQRIQIKTPTRYQIEQHKDSAGSIDKAYREKLATLREQYRIAQKELEESKGQGLRYYGEWLTSDETPQFAYTISARMWERVMGFSLTETLGVYEKAAGSDYPELWQYLAALMKEYNYDLKRFQRTLASTQAFQAKTHLHGENPSAAEKLIGRSVQRISAEQAWDSLLVLASEDPDSLPKRKRKTNLIFKGYDLGPIKEILSEIESMGKEEYTEYLKVTYRKMVEGGFPRVVDAKNKEAGIFRNRRRASELASPIKKGHFLYTFGQSSRAVTDDSTKEGSVSQALMMYNGVVQSEIVYNSKAFIHQQLLKAKEPEEAIEILFQTILTRSATDEEQAACMQEIDESGKRKGYKNVISALLSSQEFLFAL